MIKVYKSRIDKLIIALFIVSIVIPIVLLILCFYLTWLLLIDVAITVVVTWLIIDILLHTDYTITNDKLIIRCGALYRMDLPIHKIISITKKSSILSSPALSLKRIGIRYGKYRRVYISPTDQDIFIRELQNINPKIHIE